jgi:hypothetical protein
MPDALADVERALEKLVASEQSLDVERMHKVKNTCDALWARAVEEYDRSEAYRDEGFLTARSAIGTKCRAEASSDLALGRKLRNLPHVAEAFGRGEISRQHAQAFANAYTPARAAELAEIEAGLVGVARKVTPKQLGQVVRRYTDALDGDDGASRAERERNASAAYLAKTIDSMWALRGTFDDEWGQTIDNALTALMGPPRKDDTRTLPQKRAEALVELCRLGAAQFKDGNWVKPRADVTLHLDISDIERRAGSRGLAEIVRAELTSAHGLSRATLRMLTCDCKIARVITDGPSQVLDVGRATHTVPVPMRRAVEANHPTCTERGCTVPSWMCDMHHIVHWDDGGPTCADNLEPRCPYHHLLAHLREHDPP